VSGTHAENEFPQAPPGKAVAPIDGLDRAFQTLADRALRETGASSVAIGLLREGGVFCRATAGLPMTVVGDPINSETGLTGLAIRRQMSQWCTDTESDTRVDREVCRQLGVRSIIVVPVLVQDSVVAVFAIFSRDPDALSLADLNTVKKLSHWVSEAFRYTIRKPSPGTFAPAIVNQKAPDHQPPPHIFSGRQGRLRNYAAKLWRTIARVKPAGQNGHTG
jgi:GAF domain